MLSLAQLSPSLLTESLIDILYLNYFPWIYLLKLLHWSYFTLITKLLNFNFINLTISLELFPLYYFTYTASLELLSHLSQSEQFLAAKVPLQIATVSKSVSGLKVKLAKTLCLPEGNAQQTDKIKTRWSAIDGQPPSPGWSPTIPRMDTHHPNSSIRKSTTDLKFGTLTKLTKLRPG